MISSKFTLTDTDGKCESKLSATLTFKDEVAPKDTKDVKGRLKFKRLHRNYSYFKNKNHENLLGYLLSSNFDTSTTPARFHENKQFLEYFYDGENKVKYHIKSSPRKMKLKINAEADKKLEKKDFIDLDKLYNFILTGNV